MLLHPHTSNTNKLSIIFQQATREGRSGVDTAVSFMSRPRTRTCRAPITLGISSSRAHHRALASPRGVAATARSAGRAAIVVRRGSSAPFACRRAQPRPTNLLEKKEAEAEAYMVPAQRRAAANACGRTEPERRRAGRRSEGKGGESSWGGCGRRPVKDQGGGGSRAQHGEGGRRCRRRRGFRGPGVCPGRHGLCGGG